MDRINNLLAVGDVIVLPGLYKRRSIWQWLRNEPREPQKYIITATTESYSEYEVSNG